MSPCFSPPSKTLFSDLHTNYLKRFDKINDTLFETHELNAQNLRTVLVTEPIRSFLGVPATAGLLVWQFIFKLGEVLAENIDDLLVTKVARDSEETLSSGFINLERAHVSKCDIADVCPEIVSCLGDDGTFVFASDEFEEAEIGGIKL